MNKRHVRISDIIITKQNYTVIFEMLTVNRPHSVKTQSYNKTNWCT